MELLQLKYFQSVAKYENITKAAKELHISQPSLSITIKRLEDELNVPLFNRKGKKIELSVFGKNFLKHVDSIMSQIENAKSEILEMYGQKNTHLSITTNASFFLSGVLKEFLMVNSEITLTQSIINEYDDIKGKLQDRSIDFAITSPSLDDPDIETIDLIEEEIVVVIPKTHPLAHKKFIYLSEVKDEDFIEVTENNSFKNITNKLFEQAGFSPNVIFEGDSYIISELLETKRVVSLAPVSICLKSKSNFYSILRLKDKNKTRKISISYKKGIHLSELSKKFLDHTIDYYKNSWYIVKNSDNEYIKDIFSDVLNKE